MSDQEQPQDRDRKDSDREDSDRKDSARKGSDRSGHKPWHRRPGIVGLIILIVIVVVVGGMLIWRNSRTHATTDDAYIDVVSQRVSPQVPGRVLRVLVHDNENVRVGQDLVDLDPADYLVRRQQALAAVAQADAQITEAEAQRTVYAAQLAEAQASLGTAEANATNASDQLGRYAALRKENAGAVSGQQWDNAVAAQRTAAAQLLTAQKAVSAAQAQQGYAASLVRVAQAGVTSAQAQERTAELNLSYTQVRARVAGTIASKTVAPGDNLQAGTNLMAVVPFDVYVTANFKETQLDRMRPGQSVKISVDAYPDLKLMGHVDSVQPATGQALSLLPAENATGNWVKVVQRVPVKVVFDRPPELRGARLSPGMSVDVSVDLR